MSWLPQGVKLTYEKGALPAGSTLKPVDGTHVLLHYRGPKHVDRYEIIGFLLDRNRMIIGVALAEQDADKARPITDCAILNHDGTVTFGMQRLPNYEAWLAAMAERDRASRS
jgi:hypothetical protein